MYRESGATTMHTRVIKDIECKWCVGNPSDKSGQMCFNMMASELKLL